MLDFFDEKHWWNQAVKGTDKPLSWCPIHNRYYDESTEQTCLVCGAERNHGRVVVETVVKGPNNPFKTG